MRAEMTKIACATQVVGAMLATVLLACGGGSQALRGPGSGQPVGDTGQSIEVGGLEVSNEVSTPRAPEVPTGTQSSDIMYRDTTYHPNLLQLAIRRRIEHAAKHRSQAKALASSESEECRVVLPEERAQCPLLEAVEGVDRIPGGVRLRLASWVDPETFLHHVRCHMSDTHPGPAAQVCPLYVPRVSVRTASAHHVDILASEPGELEELMRRVEQHLMPLGPEPVAAPPPAVAPVPPPSSAPARP